MCWGYPATPLNPHHYRSPGYDSDAFAYDHIMVGQIYENVATFLVRGNINPKITSLKRTILSGKISQSQSGWAYFFIETRI